MKTQFTGSIMDLINEPLSMESINLNEFPDYIKEKYTCQPITKNTEVSINADIERYCTNLYHQGKINKDFMLELIRFFKIRLEYK